MSSRTLARRLVAFQEGRALPCGETLHLPIAQPTNLLMVAFLRMGGESSPWAVGYGMPGQSRAILSVPEPRNRTLVAQMMAQFSGVLMDQVRRAASASEVQDVCQVWLPNDSHVEMLHFLAYRYVFAKQADRDIVMSLNRLGRAANALFQEAQRPGQTVLMSATSALRDAFAFPADDVRQQHLGFLLPWLDAEGDRSTRSARAQEAERLSVSTSLAPEVEALDLEGAVERWNKLHRAGRDEPGLRGEASAIQSVLAAELNRRLDAVEAATRYLREDVRRLNRGVDELVRTTSRRLEREMPVIENGAHENDGQRYYVTSPDTDNHPQFAAARFFELEEAHDAWISLLIHDDKEMQADAIAEGDAIRGTIEEVRDEGSTRKRVPVWIVGSPSEGPLRLREGHTVCIAGCRKREARIRRIENRPAGGRIFELEIVLGKRSCEGQDGTWSAAHDASHVGMDVTFVETYPSEIHRLKKASLWKSDKPGDWVHRLGRPELAVQADEVDE